MKRICVLIGLLMFVWCLGCGKKLPEGMPPLQSCTLIMLQDGKPVDDVLVRLYPMDKSLSKWTVGAISQKNGEAVLKTLGQYNGAPAGKYKVTAMKTLIQDVEGAKLTEEQKAEGIGVPQKKTIYVNPKYEFENTTDLVVEIYEGTNREEIDLGAPMKKEEAYNPNKF
ncbi:MAG: hypothetical protein LBJ67_16015 [Planctomycetaceae bacterium]|jgi:hypothetical protein|nr:hypothetical protein [Planctomycetaceae bacterium]